jgi:hypothetical protein
MTSGILAAVVIVFIGAGVIALSLARIADLADRNLPHPPEPEPESEDVAPLPHRKPGGGWVT